jgi:hypothetical protein
MALINDFIAVVGLIFGLLIIVFPDLLSYLIGSFLIFYSIIKLSQTYLKKEVK